MLRYLRTLLFGPQVCVACQKEPQLVGELCRNLPLTSGPSKRIWSRSKWLLTGTRVMELGTFPGHETAYQRDEYAISLRGGALCFDTYCICCLAGLVRS